MPKLNTPANRLTLLFVLIFLVGVLGFVAYINNSLTGNHILETSDLDAELSVPE